eukprot:scaffold7312_cov116-Isochrysis_galbana.AAC.5
MAAYCRPPGGAGGGGRYGDAELDDYDGSGEDDGSEGDECAQGNAQFSGRPYVPPASSAAGTGPSFGENMESHFLVPRRLQDKPYELIEAANDWHYAMMNDIPRNEFYLSALQQLVTPETVVLEIGAGSGLLSIIAASLGAKCVVAIEANLHLANVAREIIRSNGYEGKIHIINKMSTDVTPAELAPYGAPDVLLSEILGTLLLGESALHYVADARRRLCAPRCAVVPARGAQFATLIESADVSSITSVKSWNGIDLDYFNSLQDTTSMVFTKQYGFRFSSAAYTELAPRTRILPIDFARDSVGVWGQESHTTITATRSGVVHAVMASWEVYGGGSLVMATHPDATLHNFPRDMQWGQALQLIEDTSADGEKPIPFTVAAGETLTIVTRHSIDGVSLQFELLRGEPPPAGAIGIGAVDSRGRRTGEAGSGAPGVHARKP